MQLALEQPLCIVPSPDRPRLDSHREHILLIEANETWASVASESLEAHGYRVTWMRSATEALEALAAPMWSGRAVTADIVLMDIDRPAIEVDSFMRLFFELVARTPPVVLVAAQPPEALSQTAEDCGAVGYVSKPYRMDDLLITVRRSLRRQVS